ncbi:5-deoxy-glucuronate isomerase [Pelagibacterium halotolerans]|uniref:5-deoxy-glucuronate isomerase n=1 Tax=Pelagibacterium halotolerans (strain DSM 22347 / JCM 15775 / CGMCC 1.7692 / B2) TaxID=1082931 RepID=G4R8N2_PELHB|nr:5-deoxy-glucuronate isomerase [Pelagibacterium halotolerans]AEQ50318.1 5-deoxy-glucuronate isomerase [Pelagibacterium halotolerans B2]QJR19696.1 5-deoxy-glucuronate isomerase [Pelagibacterium halotolerans]SEA53385.1 5-deoxyglucuronate isomerase [Pelagibacterium halotolerans]
MSELLVKPSGETGKVIDITPESAGWRYVGFALHRLSAAQGVSAVTGDREVCLVFVSGTGTVTAGGQNLGPLGGRESPFDGKPAAVYVPGNCNWSVMAETDLELAVCSAPALTGRAVRVIAPEAMSQEVRGKGTNTRYVTNILPETDGVADSLLVVEVITPGGHTSSYPPHKHDRDALPDESYLEETYYHRLNPHQGFAFQRVYTEDRTLDETLLIEDGVTTLVPKGYHPCAAIHGYDLYYLNVMAGPRRVWRFHNQPEHEWLLGG